MASRTGEEGLNYIIDGNNLMGRKRTRKELLALLADFLKLRGGRISVVFDGGPERLYPEGSAHKGVKIHYSKLGSNADIRIEEMVAKLSNPREVTVVTSDRSLANRLRTYGTRSLSAKDFISQLEKAKLVQTDPLNKPKIEGEMSEWLRYFGYEPDEEDKIY